MLGERGGICITLVDGSAMRCFAVVSVCRVSGRVWTQEETFRESRPTFYVFLTSTPRL